MKPGKLKYASLPPRQLQVLHFIEREIVNGKSPTLQEIATEHGMIIAQAQQIVQSLELKGKIKTSPGKHRSIEIVR